MDDRVRCITARRVRHIMRSAASDKVVPLHPEPALPTKRPRPSFLRVLLATPVLALLPMSGATPTPPKPVSVALHNPDMNCGISKYRMAECNPNEYVLEVLIGGRPQHDPRQGEEQEFPVF
ncbi:MAG: hypothetical protein P1P84_17405 [Deferrisomatales bacterium]|nr:hypothetical protein [Deferrisomatales bacterium]